MALYHHAVTETDEGATGDADDQQPASYASPDATRYSHLLIGVLTWRRKVLGNTRQRPEPSI